MKINKWTLGLAAVGLVSLTGGVRADDAKAPAPIPVTTALSATTISGYVDTSAVWAPGTGNNNVAPYSFNSGAKHDGFNLDSADVKISSTPGEGQWAAGYVFEAQYGPDAINYVAGTPIRQAYVDLRVPVGNGIDVQIGQWDNIIGYESNDDYKNPNWSRSYGYTLEPQSHTGILLTYKFADALSAQVGVADSLTSGANVHPNTVVPYVGAESKKAIVSLISLTAPDSWGSLKGSALYAGFDFGPSTPTIGVNGHGDNKDRQHLYLGATINTPVTGLTFGAAYDAVWHTDINGYDAGFATAIAGYGSLKIGEKASLNLRGEWAHGTPLNALGGVTLVGGVPTPNIRLDNVLAFTGTFQYDLWANVISRLEVRWDHDANGGAFGANGNQKNEVLVAANVIYKF
jgi:hypothetical protein